MTSAVAPMRYRLRQLAAGHGIATALGGPAPSGRRLLATVERGAVMISEVSARWRGRVLISETPAALSTAATEKVQRAARALAQPLPGREIVATTRCEFVLDADEDPILLALSQDGEPSSAPSVSGEAVEFRAFITAGEPRATGATVAGLLTAMDLPAGASAHAGCGDVLEIAPGHALAEVAGRGPDRGAALQALGAALAQTRIAGIASNLALLRAAAASPAMARGLADARELDALAYAPPAIEVLAAGTHTTVQDAPGRLGSWSVGVPPSGPMDDLAFRLANRLVGNPSDAAGLESTLVGPTLRFHQPTIICVAGCPLATTLDGAPLPAWRAVAVPAGAVLKVGVPTGAGCRAVIAIRHGLDVPTYLGSRATFDLGGFGGHAGRALKAGDWLPLMRPCPAEELAVCPAPLPAASRPAYTRSWEIGVLEGPHAAPDFFTRDDMAMLYATPWEVHHNSNRTGVRLIGPKPRFARRDGGEAGLHPSNIHDNAYAVGAIDFTGDMPILLGPDGPSLGGFVCPAVTIAAERWKLGQLRPGDRVRFARLTPTEAAGRQQAWDRLTGVAGVTPAIVVAEDDPGDAVIMCRPAAGAVPALCLRRSGDCYLLIEMGEAELDLALRLRVHLLAERLAARGLPGIIDLTPGIRSLQVHHDPHVLPLLTLRAAVEELEAGLPAIDAVEIPNRIVELPLSWDDPATRLATERYMRTVRADAPWCPSNPEFIRRINGLGSIAEVRDIVFSADYLVLGLGDVYLGAPVATPLDPRHRLVTTKYNPARTWTPQNAVGIGGAYLCVYGMEGPGGYQFVGRTVPVWSTWRQQGAFVPGTPWLLRPFDRLRFYQVSADELTALRADPARAAAAIRVTPARFRWAEYQTWLATHAAPIADFRQRQRAAFAAERERWAAPPLAAVRTT